VGAVDTLDAIIQASLPELKEPGPFTAGEVRKLCEQAAMLGISNERAAVHLELDKLARRFDEEGRPNTARAIREAAQRIAARLNLGWR
jgi:hypothetical protein